MAKKHGHAGSARRGKAGAALLTGEGLRARTSFLAEMLRNPKVTGAIAPSSKSLARQMVEQSGVHEADVVVEYGAGTGSFTGHILRSLKPGAKFFAIELSDTMAELFRQRYPAVRLYVASAADVGKLLKRERLPSRDSVDVVFSGLPWASFALPLQRSLLKATVEVLRPGGRLVTFSYTGFSRLTPAGQRMRRLLPRYFSTVEKSPTVLANIPPAFVFKCVK